MWSHDLCSCVFWISIKYLEWCVLSGCQRYGANLMCSYGWHVQLSPWSFNICPWSKHGGKEKFIGPPSLNAFPSMHKTSWRPLGGMVVRYRCFKAVVVVVGFLTVKKRSLLVSSRGSPKKKHGEELGCLVGILAVKEKMDGESHEEMTLQVPG